MNTIFQYYPNFTIMWGGGPIHIINIVKNIPDYKFKIITNASPDLPLIEHLGKNTLICRFLPYDRGLIPVFNLMITRILFPYNICTDLIRDQNKKLYLKQEKFDLIHFHNGIALGSNILRLALMLKRPLLIKQFNFSFISQPKLLTFHGNLYKSSVNPVIAAYQHTIIDQFENIICVDKNLYLDINEYTANTSQDKNIWFIPNSVDRYNLVIHKLSTGG